MRIWISLLLVAATLGGCKNQPIADGVVELRREELAVSVLVINLRDAYNEPVAPTPAGIPWRERFSRVAQWIALNKQPDVLMIQEMPGYWCGDRIRDYEAAYYLIDQIRQRSQIEYRIAYLLSHKVGGGYGDWWVGTEKLGGCETRGGRALLYRPDRMRNVQRDVGLDFATRNSVGSWAMNSLPCCNPRPGNESVCSLIDGPMVRSSTCSRDTPAGAAWTRRQPIPDYTFDAVFSRLELKRQPGNFIHLYNIHMSYPGGPTTPSEAVINGLVTDMEGRFATQGVPLYPPILAGDFNLGRGAIEERMPPADPSGGFSRYSILHWSPELMGVLIGNEGAFSFKQKAIVRDVRDLPDFGCKSNPDATQPPIPSDSLTLWSDHCASIYFKLLPVLDRPV
jgi:hypothetical protein